MTDGASDHSKSLALATAAMIELIAKGQAVQAAVLRGAGREDLETLRTEAHDMLDAYLDRTAEAAVAVKALLEP